MPAQANYKHLFPKETACSFTKLEPYSEDRGGDAVSTFLEYTADEREFIFNKKLTMALKTKKECSV